MFEIEDNVPVPPIDGRPKGSKYPFNAMQVGQSFYIATVAGQAALKRSEASVRHAALRFTKQNNGTVKFTVRRVDGGLRVWRVA